MISMKPSEYHSAWTDFFFFWNILHIYHSEVYALFFNIYFIIWLHIFSGGSVSKESAYNEGDLGSISGLGRSLGEGKGYPLQYSGLKNSMDSPWGHKELDTTEWLTLSHSGCTRSWLWHVESLVATFKLLVAARCLTRGWTQAPYIGSTES